MPVYQGRRIGAGSFVEVPTPNHVFEGIVTDIVGARFYVDPYADSCGGLPVAYLEVDTAAKTVRIEMIGG